MYLCASLIHSETKKKTVSFVFFLDVPIKAFLCYFAGDWKAAETMCGCSFNVMRMFKFPFRPAFDPIFWVGRTVELSDVIVIAFIFDLTTCWFARRLFRRCWRGGDIHHRRALWNCLGDIFSILLCHDDQWLVPKCPNSLLTADTWTFARHYVGQVHAGLFNGFWKGQCI